MGLGRDREDLLQVYYYMRLTRAIEDRTRTLFLQGRIVGGVYTAQGHEATTVGAAMMLAGRSRYCSEWPIVST